MTKSATTKKAHREAHPWEGRDAFERGRQYGRLYRAEGRDYGKVNGVYPSNPYPISDAKAMEFNAGYEEGFSGR